MMQLILTADEVDFLKQLFASDIAITIKTAKIIGPLQLKIEALVPGTLKDPSPDPITPDPITPEAGTL